MLAKADDGDERRDIVAFPCECLKYMCQLLVILEIFDMEFPVFKPGVVCSFFPFSSYTDRKMLLDPVICDLWLSLIGVVRFVLPVLEWVCLPRRCLALSCQELAHCSAAVITRNLIPVARQSPLFCKRSPLFRILQVVLFCAFSSVLELSIFVDNTVCLIVYLRVTGHVLF